MKWIERCRELFSQYKEYMDELTRSLENFESSVSTVEQSLSDDYEDIIFWAKRAEAGREKVYFIYNKFAVLDFFVGIFNGLLQCPFLV